MRIPGFDLGNSPREYLEPAGKTVILSTTNGTRAVVSAAQRCERVLVASLLNLSAVVEAARAGRRGRDRRLRGGAGHARARRRLRGRADRRASRLGRSDAAEAAARLASTWSGAEEALRASKSGRNLLENAPELEEDIAFCARESVLDVVPRLVALRGGAAEIAL